jgi:hypothetical protein
VTHHEKTAFLLRDLGQRGLGPQHVAPAWYRLLWHFGIEARPPHFASFWWVAAVHSCLLAVFVCGPSWIITERWLGRSRPWEYLIIALAGIVLISVIIGVAFATGYRRQARELALPRWEDYPTP